MTSCPPINKNCQYFPACGGCDFLDLEKESYQNLKKSLLKEKDIEAEWIWLKPSQRRKIILQIDKKNKLGFFAKKSNSLVEIENCFAAKKEISDFILPLKNLLKDFEENLFEQISLTLFDSGLDLIFIGKRELNFSQIQKLTNFSKANKINSSYQVKNHLAPIFLQHKNQIFYPDFKINLDSKIFIQATKSGLDAIIKIIRDNIFSNKKIIDIYSGFGAYSFAISDLAKNILAVEGSAEMVNLINKNVTENNLKTKINAQKRDLFSNPIDAKELNNFDLAIINPPRNGASPQVIEISKSKLKNLIYVSCNPQSFMRDAKILTDNNFKILKVFALDQFYATKHLELITIFEKYDKTR